MQDKVWICTYCRNQHTGRFQEIKLFKMHVDGTICTVRYDPEEYLKFANSLHNNLQFTLEKVNMEGDLAFPDINLSASRKSSIACPWSQKSPDTGKILTFYICAPLQHTNVIQGMVHTVLMQHLIGWSSIRLLQRTELAGPKISIQRNGLKKSEPVFRKNNRWR